MIDYEYIRNTFDYKNGNLVWKYDSRISVKGESIGFINNLGYKVIRLRHDKKVNTFMVHRLIYIWHNGDILRKQVISFIDKDKTNMRIENLRLRTFEPTTIKPKITKASIYLVQSKKWS